MHGDSSRSSGATGADRLGLFAGALFAGVGGSVLFGALGFLAAIPFLRRIHRRTGTWRLPAGLLGTTTSASGGVQ